MDGEIDHAGGVLQRGVQILADIVGGGDGDVGIGGGGLQQGLAHAAGFSGDEEFEHVGWCG